MTMKNISLIRVFRSPLDHRRGTLVAGNLRLPCALGRSGITRRKCEGDGCTVLGKFDLIQAFYRQDRVRRPITRLPLHPLRPHDGWCDAPNDRRYNHKVTLPYQPSHEKMWREDSVYDIVIDLSINRRPVIKGRGSALFLHMARPNYEPTAGCIAVAPRHMARLLALIGPKTKIEIRN